MKVTQAFIVPALFLNGVQASNKAKKLEEEDNQAKKDQSTKKYLKSKKITKIKTDFPAKKKAENKVSADEALRAKVEERKFLLEEIFDEYTARPGGLYNMANMQVAYGTT